MLGSGDNSVVVFKVLVPVFDTDEDGAASVGPGLEGAKLGTTRKELFICAAGSSSPSSSSAGP